MEQNGQNEILMLLGGYIINFFNESLFFVYMKYIIVLFFFMWSVVFISFAQNPQKNIDNEIIEIISNFASNNEFVFVLINVFLGLFVSFLIVYFVKFFSRK